MCISISHRAQPLNSFTPDPKKDWYTENTPLHKEIEQNKAEKIAKIKHSMSTSAKLTLEPPNTIVYTTATPPDAQTRSAIP